MTKTTPKTSKTSVDFIKISQHGIVMYLTHMSAKTLVRISYAAARGHSDEDGAVQRLLKKSRIASIKEFTLNKGLYPNSVILNWTHKQKPTVSEKLVFQSLEYSAQIIDGQHRVAGIADAIQSNPSLGTLEIPVVLMIGLNTQQCADIFLSINTEQKPVPKSLVYDLFSLSSEHIKDKDAERARDIAERLNEDADSPYFELIRFPGNESRLGVDLSTIVNALKPLVDDKGVFESVKLKELEQQLKVLRNYFDVLKEWYGPSWTRADNIFLTAAGFQGAVEFLKNYLVAYCRTRKSFEKAVIRGALELSRNDLLLKPVFKGMQSRQVMRAIEGELHARLHVEPDEDFDIKV